MSSALWLVISMLAGSAYCQNASASGPASSPESAVTMYPSGSLSASARKPASGTPTCTFAFQGIVVDAVLDSTQYHIDAVKTANFHSKT